jgi:hypothetical protein
MGVLADPAEACAGGHEHFDEVALAEVDCRHIANGKAGKVTKEASDLYLMSVGA